MIFDIHGQDLTGSGFQIDTPVKREDSNVSFITLKGNTPATRELLIVKAGQVKLDVDKSELTELSPSFSKFLGTLTDAVINYLFENSKTLFGGKRYSLSNVSEYVTAVPTDRLPVTVSSVTKVTDQYGKIRSLPAESSDLIEATQAVLHVDYLTLDNNHCQVHFSLIQLKLLQDAQYTASHFDTEAGNNANGKKKATAAASASQSFDDSAPRFPTL